MDGHRPRRPRLPVALLLLAGGAAAAAPVVTGSSGRVRRAGGSRPHVAVGAPASQSALRVLAFSPGVLGSGARYVAVTSAGPVAITLRDVQRTDQDCPGYLYYTASADLPPGFSDGFVAVVGPITGEPRVRAAAPRGPVDEPRGTDSGDPIFRFNLDLDGDGVVDLVYYAFVGACASGVTAGGRPTANCLEEWVREAGVWRMAVQTPLPTCG
jgi:hypothetical protein